MAIKMIASFIIGLVAALLAYPVAIPFLHKLKFGQAIYELGPKSHMVKAGTPPMGGVVFVLTSLLASIIVQPKAFLEPYFQLVILAFIGYGIIGFIDDYIIVIKHDHTGLRARYKMLLQSILAVAFFLAYYKMGSPSFGQLNIPVVNVQIKLGVFYFFLVFFMFTGTSNAVNLSDGLDGLCAGLTVLALIPFVIFSYKSDLPSVTVLIMGVIGSLIGYLKYNMYPAKIFMGDTGSLALGGLLAAIALVTKEEIALVLVGGVYVVETLSVILQVASFQLTGKRIFKMSPLHHHFELSGWKETKVVHTFWFVGFILSMIGVIMGVF